MRNVYYIIMCSLLLAACSSDDHETAAGGTVAVAFSAMMASTSTRAVNEIYDDATLQAKGFGVFGCHTGLYKYSDSNVRPNFMYNEHVTYVEDTPADPDADPPISAVGHWEYNPVKYWPNGEGETNPSINTGENPHYVTYMAYAPYSDNNATTPEGYCIPSFSLQGDLDNPWLTYRLHHDVSEQVDLLYAPTVLDQTKPAVDARLNFTFKHALSCVGDKITIFCSDGIKNQANSRVGGSVVDAKVVITGFTIKYTLTSKARLVLWNNDADAANWQTIWSESPICTRTVSLEEPLAVYTYSDDSHNPYVINGKGVFYIPLELEGYPQTAELSITYCVATTTNGSTWTYETENTGTASLTLHDYTAAYQSGKHLYLNITLNQMSIAFKAAIAPWEEVTPVDVEGEEE